MAKAKAKKKKQENGLSDAQGDVLRAATRAKNRKTGVVKLQDIYSRIDWLSQNSVVRKVVKLVKAGHLEKVDRGLYKVVA